jgi:hypothetical protein
MNKEKIMVIGLAKNATSSIHKLFLKNGLSSKHGGEYLRKWTLENRCGKYNSRDCWVHDFLTPTPDVSVLIKSFPSAYYILPSRYFINWIFSCIKQHLFITNTKHKKFNGLYVLDLLNCRNIHYSKTDKAINDSKTDRYVFINIDKDDIYEKITSIVPEEIYFSKYKKIPKANISKETNKSNCDKDKFIEFMKQLFMILNIKEKELYNDWIIRNTNGNIVYQSDISEDVKSKLKNLIYSA